MRRRYRRPRDIPFGLDSFLDLVANVIGVIIRLILVVWVGARSYSSWMQLVPEPPPTAIKAESPADLDPLRQQIARQRQELDRTRSRLLEQARQITQVQAENARQEQVLAASAVHERDAQKPTIAAPQHDADGRKLTEVLADLETRRQRLSAEVARLEQLPPARNLLLYRTPISRPVQAEELLFECRAGRVSFVDIGGFIAEVQRDLDDKVQLLRTRWQVEATAGPIGAFRFRYTLERERGVLGGGGGNVAPPSERFRYGLSEWRVEPIAAVRGETQEEALSAGSAFRQVVDTVDPVGTAITFAVYPDSFALYRRLRDYLHDRNVEVAARPLPHGSSIVGSPYGTRSQGQ